MLEKQQGIVDRALSMLRIKKEVGDAHISSQLHLRLVVTSLWLSSLKIETEVAAGARL